MLVSFRRFPCNKAILLRKKHIYRDFSFITLKSFDVNQFFCDLNFFTSIKFCVFKFYKAFYSWIFNFMIFYNHKKTQNLSLRN